MCATGLLPLEVVSGPCAANLFGGCWACCNKQALVMGAMKQLWTSDSRTLVFWYSFVTATGKQVEAVHPSGQILSLSVSSISICDVGD